MLQSILIIAGCLFLLSINVCLGAALLIAGFKSKDKNFFEDMQKVEKWIHQTSEDGLLLENKKSEEKE